MTVLEHAESQPKSADVQQQPEQWNTISLLGGDSSHQSGDRSSGNSSTTGPDVVTSDGTLDFGNFDSLYGSSNSAGTNSALGDSPDTTGGADFILGAGGELPLTPVDEPQPTPGDEPPPSSENDDRSGRNKPDKNDGRNKNQRRHYDGGTCPIPEGELYPDVTEGGDEGLDRQALETEYQNLAAEQDLQVRPVEVDGRTEYEFYATIDGDEQVVLQTRLRPEIAEHALNRAQENMVTALEHTYGVDIAEDGETLEESEDESYPVTTPTLGELAAVERALLKSLPDTTTVDGNPLRIYVADDSWGDYHRGGGYATGDKIVLGYSEDLAHLAEVGVHEIAHIGQSRRESVEGEDGYASEMGWVKAGDDWVLKGKEDTYWQNVGEDVWVRTDSEGNAVDADGNRIEGRQDTDSAQTATSAEVRDMALVKPYSDYAENPAEMGASMLTPFRYNSEMRADLYQVSPETYAIAKNLDQYQINLAYGTQENGEAKYIRNPDGIVVPNTADNQELVAAYEATLPLQEPKYSGQKTTG